MDKIMRLRTIGRGNKKQCGKIKSIIDSCISQLHVYNVTFLHLVNMHNNMKKVLLLRFHRWFMAWTCDMCYEKFLLVIDRNICYNKSQINWLFPSWSSRNSWAQHYDMQPKSLINQLFPSWSSRKRSSTLWHANVSLCNPLLSTR